MKARLNAYSAVAHRPGDGGDRVVAVAQPPGGQVHPPLVGCAAGVSPTAARQRRASVARQTPVTVASDSTVHERDLRTNYLGTLRVILAFVPALEHNAPAAVVNALVLVAARTDGPRIPRLWAWRQPAGSSYRDTEATVRSG
jgi:hypothetical protein